MGRITAVPVMRDESGWWSHPDLPSFDEGDGAKYRTWVDKEGLETTFSSLEDEPDDHPSRIACFDDGESDVSDWNPTPPAGNGWFPLSIHDADDGPLFWWARRLAIGEFGDSSR